MPYFWSHRRIMQKFASLSQHFQFHFLINPIIFWNFTFPLFRLKKVQYFLGKWANDRNGIICFIMYLHRSNGEAEILVAFASTQKLWTRGSEENIDFRGYFWVFLMISLEKLIFWGESIISFSLFALVCQISGLMKPGWKLALLLDVWC